MTLNIVASKFSTSYLVPTHDITIKQNDWDAMVYLDMCINCDLGWIERLGATEA